MLLGLRSLWENKVVPPTPQVVSSPGMVVPWPDSWLDADRKYKELQRQNADDLEVIEFLTQFMDENDG